MNSLSAETMYAAGALLATAAAAWTDVRSRRIPNVLTGPAFGAGLVLHGALGGWHDAAGALGTGVLCGGVFLLFFVAGGMGAGDVKLIAAAGCLAGWPCALPLLTWTAVCGGVMALGLALWRGKLRETLHNMLALLAHHGREGLRPHAELHVLNAGTLRLPYGVAIALGCALTVLPLVGTGAR